MKKQNGGTILGFVMGLVVGLGVALAVAVYITKVPVQFLSKGQTRTSDQDAAETKKNKDWNPNAGLSGKNPAKPATPAAATPDSTGIPTAAPASVSAPVTAPAVASKKEVKPAVSADPLGELANVRSAAASNEPFIYFVQVDAFRAPEAAESLRAKLALSGVEAKVTEREQSGRTVYRVRVGPFDRKEEAEKAKQKLDTPDHETALVRVQR